MRVLITGGAGFIGSNVVKLLESKGSRTIVVDDFSHANFKNLEGVRSEVICASILDETLFKRIGKIDALIVSVISNQLRKSLMRLSGFQAQRAQKETAVELYPQGGASWGSFWP